MRHRFVYRSGFSTNPSQAGDHRIYRPPGPAVGAAFSTAFGTVSRWAILDLLQAPRRSHVSRFRCRAPWWMGQRRLT